MSRLSLALAEVRHSDSKSNLAPYITIPTV